MSRTSVDDIQFCLGEGSCEAHVPEDLKCHEVEFFVHNVSCSLLTR